MRFHVILWLACCSGAVVASLNHFMDASFPHNPLNQLDQDELDITPIPTSPIEDHVLGVHEDAEAKLDTAFYSRQLYVYGKSAQVKLTNAHIAIIGDGALAQEIVKNLALGGVGYITIVTDAGVAGMDTDRSKQASILGEDSDLLHYAKALNPHVHVDQLEYHNHTLPTEDVLGRNISHVIVCGEDLHRLLEINRWTRQHFLRLTAGQVQGVSGYIFNDFHFAFDIEDIEGESYKDIPLKFQCQLLEEERIEVSSIDEERLNYGLEDVVEIRSAKNIDHVYHGIVKRIISPTTCVVHIVDERFDMRGFLQGMKELIEAGDAVIQKMKSQLTIAHQPLLHQLLKPKFIPINGCLSKKQDQALNLALFAAIKTQDMLSRRNKASKKISDRVFFELMLQELQLLGVEDPLLPLKQGGKVGKEWIDYVFSRFYHSAAGGQCPATISVLGSLMAQEVMKGITQMYTPISQWYLFESLDALHDNQSKSRSVEDMKRSVEYHVQAASLDHKTSRAGSAVDMYDFEVLEEIRKMKIFIVGSGAIGCELLKTFALLGIGANEASTQSQDMENVGEDEELPSYDSLNLWQEHGLSDGGILITDMDMIERSNLNRQLLFR